MNIQVQEAAEANKLCCVVTDCGNGVRRLSVEATQAEVVPNLCDLSYPLSESLADLIQSAGYHAAQFAMGFIEGTDIGTYRATLWRVISMALVGVACMEYARNKSIAMLVSAAMCMATPPVFQIGQAYDDRWYPAPPACARTA